jgi:hypothetical protein
MQKDKPQREIVFPLEDTNRFFREIMKCNFTSCLSFDSKGNTIITISGITELAENYLAYREITGKEIIAVK